MEPCYIKLVNKNYVYRYGHMNTYNVAFMIKEDACNNNVENIVKNTIDSAVNKLIVS